MAAGTVAPDDRTGLTPAIASLPLVEPPMAFASPLDRFSRFMARHTTQHWLPLQGEQAVISVTFDDILASAAHDGARILEDHGCRGTFYIAGSLTAGHEGGRRTHTLDTLQALHAQGHEIASHGWGHADYTRMPPEAMAADLQDNLAFLRRHLDLPAEINFAYPFGRYGLASKRLSRHLCLSSRILGRGLHRHRADLNLLGCERLYGPGRHRTHWEPLIQAMTPGSWLIVSTHEVETDCGDYGCTPSDLSDFVDIAQRHQCLILPIREAIGHWSRHTPSPPSRHPR